MSSCSFSCYQSILLPTVILQKSFTIHPLIYRNSTTKVPFDGPTLQVLVNAEIDKLKALVPQPDLVLWCDNQGATNDALVPFVFPLPLMKAKNYLPKALSVLDALDNDLTTNYGTDINYVVAADFLSSTLTGNLFTEGETPYANYFRPPNPVQF